METFGSVAFLPGGSQFLLGQSRPEVNLGLFSLDDVDAGANEVQLPGAVKYGRSRAGYPAEILISRDGTVAHLVGRYGRVTTHETTSLEQVAPPITHRPFVLDPDLMQAMARSGVTTTPQVVFADLSPDERYLVTNRWYAPEINVLDLQERRSWTLAAGAGITMTGGVAFDHGPNHPGLLAVNVLHSVVVYRFHPDGPLEELVRQPIHPVNHFADFARTKRVEVPGNVAWSASGDALIVPIDHGPNDFAILEVARCGAQITRLHEIAVCDDTANLGRAIWTANKRQPLSANPGTRCPTPELRSTATPPPPPPATRTPIATPLVGELESVKVEEKVLAIEASTDGAAAGCGGLSFFQVGDGRRRYGSPFAVAQGRVAAAWGGNTLIVGPTDPSDQAYDVLEDPGVSNGQDELGTRWRRGTVSPTVGIPLPYGTIAVLWADTHVLLSYRRPTSGRATLGLFERFTQDGPTPATPLAEVEFERGIPAAIALEDYTGDDAITRYSGVAWVVTDIGEVWRVTIRDMEAMTLEGPVALIAPPAALPGDDGPAARRVLAALSAGERYLLVGGWGDGVINVVDLKSGGVRRARAGDGLTMAGQIATNRGWENEGLVALHAGDHIVVYALDEADGSLVELYRQAIPPPRDEALRPVPGYVAWGTNGLTLIATIDEGVDEFAVFWVRGCGRALQELYRVAGCPQDGVRNRGRIILTNNGLLEAPAGYQARCPAAGVPPTLTPGTPVPSKMPSSTPTPSRPAPVAWAFLPYALRLPAR